MQWQKLFKSTGAHSSDLQRFWSHRRSRGAKTKNGTLTGHTWRLEDFANTKAASKEFIRGSANCLAPAQVKKNTTKRKVTQVQADNLVDAPVYV